MFPFFVYSEISTDISDRLKQTRFARIIETTECVRREVANTNWLVIKLLSVAIMVKSLLIKYKLQTLVFRGFLAFKGHR